MHSGPKLYRAAGHRGRSEVKDREGDISDHEYTVAERLDVTRCTRHVDTTNARLRLCHIKMFSPAAPALAASLESLGKL